MKKHKILKMILILFVSLDANLMHGSCFLRLQSILATSHQNSSRLDVVELEPQENNDDVHQEDQRNTFVILQEGFALQGLDFRQFKNAFMQGRIDELPESIQSIIHEKLEKILQDQDAKDLLKRRAISKEIARINKLPEPIRSIAHEKFENVLQDSHEQGAIGFLYNQDDAQDLFEGRAGYKEIAKIHIMTEIAEEIIVNSLQDDLVVQQYFHHLLDKAIKKNKNINEFKESLIDRLMSTFFLTQPVSPSLDYFKEYKKADVSFMQKVIAIYVERYGYTRCLHSIIKKDNCENLKFLIGLDPTIIHRCHDQVNTPLDIASKNNALKIILLLVDYGVNINGLNFVGVTPLHLAVYSRKAEAISLLLACGAEVDSMAHNFGTPLHIATRFSCLEVIPLLIEAGANMNALDDLDNSPLHYAAKNDDEESIRLLINSGANIHLRNKDGREARDMTKYASTKILFEDPAN